MSPPPEFPVLKGDQFAFAVGFFETKVRMLHQVLDAAAAYPGSKTALLGTVVGLRDDVADWPADLARLLAARAEAFR